MLSSVRAWASIILVEKHDSHVSETLKGFSICNWERA